jgi:uncharacterized protein YdbL (DUF1318 family)
MQLSTRSLILVALGASAVVAQAADLDSAKSGMRERVPQLDQLKAAGAVGEANTGLLAVRAPGAETERFVAAENADRAILFAELAKKTGGTAESAGKIFAKQIAAASKAGVWIQREDGGWFRK